MFAALHTLFVSAKPIAVKPPRDARGFKHRAGTVVMSPDGQHVLLITRFAIKSLSNALFFLLDHCWSAVEILEGSTPQWTCIG